MKAENWKTESVKVEKLCWKVLERTANKKKVSESEVWN